MNFLCPYYQNTSLVVHLSLFSHSVQETVTVWRLCNQKCSNVKQKLGTEKFYKEEAMIGIWSLNSQHIRCFLWDPQLTSSHTTILSPVNRVLLLEISLCIICILTHRIYKDVPAHKGFTNKILYVFLSSPVLTTCHIHFILCLTFGSAYRLNHIIFSSHQVLHLPFYPKYPSH